MSSANAIVVIKIKKVMKNKLLNKCFFNFSMLHLISARTSLSLTDSLCQEIDYSTYLYINKDLLIYPIEKDKFRCRIRYNFKVLGQRDVLAFVIYPLKTYTKESCFYFTLGIG